MSNYFISCDWGTSNLRLYLVEAESLQIIAEYSNENGIKAFYKKWQQSAQDRELYYLNFLEEQIDFLSKQSGKDLSEVYAIASGMVTSSLGLVELPYASIPKKIIADQLNSGTINRFSLISGLKSVNDVMRGEETLLLGIMSDHPDFQGTIILPGTHSKHAIIAHGILEDFHTYLSGEIFQLLVNESSLSHTMETCKIMGNELLESTFLSGIKASENSNLLNKVFHARANTLLKDTTPKENYAYLSGIIIGSEISNITEKNQEIILCGNVDLCELYSLAIRSKEIKSVKYYPDKIAMIKGHSSFFKST